VRRAYIGVAGGSRPLPPRAADRVGRREAVEVVEVVEGSPAALAGIRQEDLVLEIDGRPVANSGDLQRLMTGERIGRTVPMRVLRAGQVLDLSITPVELDV
jgi:S1-C subfamily serine protease